MTLLGFFENHNNGLHFSLSISLPLSSHPPPPTPLYLTLKWHLWAITITFSYKASQQRKLLYWRSQREFFWLRRGVAGRRDGCLLRIFIHVCRRGHTWVDPYCGGDLPVTTQSSFMRVSGVSLCFSSCLSTLDSLSMSAALHYFKSLYIIYQKPFVLLVLRFWRGDTTKQRPVNYIVKPWWRKYLRI